jgi:hypothetical protein
LRWKGESELVARTSFEPQRRSLSARENCVLRLHSRSHSVKLERLLNPVIQRNIPRNVTAAMQILFVLHRSFPYFATNVPRAESETGGRP